MIGMVSNGKRGTEPKDRSGWDWSLKNIELAKIYGVSRQRISVIRKVYGRALPRAKKTALDERKTRPARSHDLPNEAGSVQVPPSDSLEQAS